MVDKITWQAPKIKTQPANQQPEMMVKDEAEVVVGGDSFIKGEVDEGKVLTKH